MRYLFGFVVVLLLGVAGCGQEPLMRECEKFADCGDPCEVYCDHRSDGSSRCVPREVDCKEDRGECWETEYDECDPEAYPQICGRRMPINEGAACNSAECCCVEGNCIPSAELGDKRALS
jgi:hypothetical protein